MESQKFSSTDSCKDVNCRCRKGHIRFQHWEPRLFQVSYCTLLGIVSFIDVPSWSQLVSLLPRILISQHLKAEMKKNTILLHALSFNKCKQNFSRQPLTVFPKLIVQHIKPDCKTVLPMEYWISIPSGHSHSVNAKFETQGWEEAASCCGVRRWPISFWAKPYRKVLWGRKGGRNISWQECHASMLISSQLYSRGLEHLER